MFAKNADAFARCNMRLSRVILPLFFVFFYFVPSWAHLGFHTKTIRALLKSRGLYFSIQITFPEGAESFHRRERWDTNRDGRLDPGEMEKVFSEIQSRFCNLAVVLNKLPLTMRRTEAHSMGLIGHTDTQDEISISLQFEISLPRTEGIGILSITDHPKPGTHCPIVFQVGKGVKLLKYSGRLRTVGNQSQISYVLDQKHKLVVSFIAI